MDPRYCARSTFFGSSIGVGKDCAMRKEYNNYLTILKYIFHFQITKIFFFKDFLFCFHQSIMNKLSFNHVYFMIYQLPFKEIVKLKR